MVLVSLLLAAPLLIQGDETVKDFRKFYRKEKDVLNKVELIYSLEGIDAPDVARALLPILSDEDSLLAQAALKVAIQLESPEARAPFRLLLEEGKPKESIAPVLRAAAEAGWEEFALVTRPYLESKQEILRLWAVTAVGSMKDVESLPALAMLVTADPHPLVRAASVEAVVLLGIGHEAVAGPALVAALQDESVSVSSAACRGLRTIRVREAIEPLIDLLENGKGRVLEEVWPTLIELTDLQFTDDAATWRRWWSRSGDTYVMPTDVEIANRRAERAETNAEYRPTKAEAEFMGVATSSREIVFVIDVSGSMEELVLNREGFRERGFTKFMKLDIVKEELSRSIEALGDNVFFNVYAFATEVDPWRKKLVPANALQKRAAVAWIRKLKPLGGSGASAQASAGLTASSGLDKGRTNTFAALLAGMGVEANPRKRGPATELAAEEGDGEGDTMFFLSDGKPTVGELVDTEDILRSIIEFNRFRKMVIHTIAIGDFTSNFLEKLAKQNGGVFVDLGR